MEGRKLLIGLNMIPGLGPKRIYVLSEHFKSWGELLDADDKDLTDILGSGKLTQNILDTRSTLDPEHELEKANRLGISIITLQDSTYPMQLKEIYDPPPVLYVLGDLSLLREPGIALVGTRKATAYGKNVALKLAQDLASKGINVVSGMARGIDTFAHKGALAAGGPTTAVWGSGMDIVYPRENRSLAKEIAEAGCIVTCFPLGQKPLPGNFPARNRIISGLSVGVVVVEAAEKSGALITADFALEQGREVFAVPGGIFSPYSRGSHKIIKQGAKLVESVSDILDELYIESDCHLDDIDDNPLLLTEEERALVEVIDYHPTHIEEIIHKTMKTSQQINVLLTQLELKGAIEYLAGGYVMRLK